MEGYAVYRSNRLLREHLEFMEYCLGIDRPTESSWIRSKEKIGVGVVSAKDT